MKQLLTICLCFAALGCNQVASRNPMDASMAPVAASPLCPSQYNFEAPGSQLAWQAPSWAPGNNGAPQRISWTSACGGFSLREKLAMTGSGDGLLYSTFSSEKNFDGRSLALYIRFDPAPPTDIGFRPQFIDYQNNWVGTDEGPRFGIGGGWVLVQRTFIGAPYQRVMAINLQVVSNNGAAYTGDIYVDEINY